MISKCLSSGAEGGRAELLSGVKAVVLSFLQGTSAKVYLFGSFAKSEERHSSDIDLAVDHAGQVSPHMFATLRELLHESSIPYQVDVVDLYHVAESFRTKVRQEGILWSE
ncbi:MAG: nucleotidyltransferase domain-containing protein [Firmicutes bacterium]|nr:nucleotidyltransferase domain-containing protein [Dethiobacter sp.]MBS3888617.1 nucleotidyltransferase domain-containing protein [Bacillota bacterium]MBS4053798.1 nucleotidyltransferase domain-containing protein [Thermaerobacter sp.]